MTYLGVKPGFNYYLWHPYDIKTLKWDESITEIDEDTVGNISYEESPYEAPTKILWIEHDRYPMVQAKNLTGKTANPEVIFIAMLYVVQEHEDIDSDTLAKLRAGAIESMPIWFGGEL